MADHEKTAPDYGLRFWRDMCREICAYKGEPPCWDERVAGDKAAPCEVCEPASAYMESALALAEKEGRRAGIKEAHETLTAYTGSFNEQQRTCMAVVLRALAEESPE